MSATADEMAAALRWVVSGDTGISSKAIMARMLGEAVDWHTWPRDPADLGRCLRLLDRIPPWKARIQEMAPVSGPWAALAGNWAALEANMLSEVGIGWEKGRRAPLTYTLMRELIDLGLRADPRVTIEHEHEGRICSYRWRAA